MSTSKLRREVLAAVRPEVEAAGLACRIEVRPGHDMLIVTATDGRCHKTPIACTPKYDVESVVRKKRADVRQIIRKLAP